MRVAENEQIILRYRLEPYSAESRAALDEMSADGSLERQWRMRAASGFRRVEKALTNLRDAAAKALLDRLSHQQRLAECRDLVSDFRNAVDGEIPGAPRKAHVQEAAVRYCDAVTEALTLHAKAHSLNL